MDGCNQQNLLPGVSGMMRVKNDGQFIEACVESCIGALDELVIVWNDCSDNSAEEIEKMRQRYPDKIKTYEYKHKVYSVNLTKEEYEYAKSLPADSPNLLCNYYNFCLSKVTHRYAMKIDADQIYFTDQLKFWCDVAKSEETIRFQLSDIYYYFRQRFFGMLCWLSSSNIHFPRRLYGDSVTQASKNRFVHFAKYMFKRKGWNLMISGVNVVNIDGKWYTTLGEKGDDFNLLPPFNGIGDHLIFEVTPQCHYEVADMPSYSLSRSDSYTLIELFVCKPKLIPVGFSWWHVNMMRPDSWAKVKRYFDQNPARFEEVDSFLEQSVSQMEKSIDDEMFNGEAMAVLRYIYPFGWDALKRNLERLKALRL